MAPTSYQLPALTSPLGVCALVLGSLIVVYFAERFVFGQPVPADIPRLREPVGARRFSLRTRLAYYTDCEQLFREAYENYSKVGKAVVIPGLGFRSEVILPQSSMRWIIAQPESSLSVGEAHSEIDMAHWSVGKKVIEDSWQGNLVKTELNRVLENTSAALNDELHRAFDESFGTDTVGWKEIDLASTIGLAVAQAAARFTVGTPLCRDKDYLQLVISINSLLVMNAGVTGALPRVLQHILGPSINIPIRRKLAKLKAILIPIWNKRLETLKYDRDDPSHDEPQDHMQMMVRYAAEHCPEELHDENLITRRLSAANFGAVHQTSIQVTNLLLNIIGSDSEFNTIAALRDESDRILGPDPDVRWTKALASQLSKADSASRETLRLNSFGGRSVMRKVLVDNFRTDQGDALPKGTVISFLGQPAQTDEKTLDDPLKYDPFRFSRMREDAASRSDKVPAVSFVTTSPEFLPFGHGKHACPGRFLIDFEMKMILNYVLRNYDLKFPDEYKGRRPPNTWLAEALFPPDGVKILVRRRVVN